MLESLDHEDVRHCERLLRAGSKSFHAASLILPERVRTPASVVYAFCRIMDDAIDEGADRPHALRELGARLDRIYAGAACDHPVDRALSYVVRDRGLPRAVFDGLLEGFAWDVEGHRYDTFDDVVGYGVRVAGTVGVAMSVLMGQREATVLDRACELGVAMQLTNIARDVGEDARAGRLYLPAAWLAAEGVDVQAFRAAPRLSEGLRAVVLRLLDEADVLYRAAAVGIRSLPGDCRPSIRAARAVYAAIGDDVRRHGGDSISRRAHVPGWRKSLLLLRALGPTQGEGAPVPPRFAAGRWLVDEVAT